MLFEAAGNGNYKINTSRRDSPGMVELHEKDSDIIYVVKGSATFITGGTLLDGKKVADYEIRGMQLNGGARGRWWTATWSSFQPGFRMVKEFIQRDCSISARSSIHGDDG